LSKPVLHTVEAVDKVKNIGVGPLWTAKNIKKSCLAWLEGSCCSKTRDQKIAVMRIGRQSIMQNPLGGFGAVHNLAVGEPYDLPTLVRDIILPLNETIEVLSLTEFCKAINFNRQPGRPLDCKINKIWTNRFLRLNGGKPLLI